MVEGRESYPWLNWKTTCSTLKFNGTLSIKLGVLESNWFLISSNTRYATLLTLWWFYIANMHTCTHAHVHTHTHTHLLSLLLPHGVQCGPEGTYLCQEWLSVSWLQLLHQSTVLGQLISKQKNNGSHTHIYTHTQSTLYILHARHVTFHRHSTHFYSSIAAKDFYT